MKPAAFQTYTNTDLVVRVTVAFDAGAPIQSLTGAEVDARARQADGTLVIGEAEVEGSSVIIVTFRRGALAQGRAEMQVWARVGLHAAMPAAFDVDVRQGFRPANE